MNQSSVALFIESNTTPTGVQFLKRAVEEGLKPVILVQDRARYPFLDGLSEIETVICETSNYHALSRTIDEISASQRIALVMSSSDYFVEHAANQAARLKLAGPDPEAVAICRNKKRQHEVLAQSGVSVPARAIEVTCECQAYQAIKTIGLPAVVKPVAGTGSLGVRLARNGNELEEAVADIMRVKLDGRGRSIKPRALISSFLPGDEYSVEILDGVIHGITAKHLGNLPYFVEIAHDFPASIAPPVREKIEATALAAISAVGLTSGPAHVELRADGLDIAIVEINPRLAGGAIPDLVNFSTGLDLVRATLRSAAGLPLQEYEEKRQFAALRFIVPQKPGLFAPNKSEADLQADHQLEAVSYYKPFPIDFTPRHDFHDRLGHVIGVGDTAALATWRANGAIGELFDNEENTHA